jgi:hypothetical protein
VVCSLSAATVLSAVGWPDVETPEMKIIQRKRRRGTFEEMQRNRGRRWDEAPPSKEGL